jgi:AcrR family transcriptional regulator
VRVSESSGQTRARGRARREQLLNAALVAFAAHGYRGASMGAIAEEVGISLPGLLHHFPSKPALLFGVLEHHDARVKHLIGEVAASGGTLADQLMLIAREHESDPSFIRLFTVLAAESVDSGHPAHAWFVDRYRRVRSAWADAIARDQLRGQLRAELDPEQLARLFVAVLDGLELQYLLEPVDGGIASPLEALLEALRAP